MFLDATTKSIELVLSTASTTNNMPVVVDYVDLTTTTTLAGEQDSASNGTTAVTILSAPAASTQRKINGITVYNADTVSKIVTVNYNNNATLRPLVVVTLQVGDTLGYTDQLGWYVQDTSGNRKVTVGAGGGSVTTVSVVSANGLAGTVANATTTPAITLSTTITGVLKGNGTAISAATAGTDYSEGTSALATGIVKSTTTTGALTIAVAGDFPTLNQNTTGTASNVTGTVAIANGGTGQTTATAAFDALAPTTTQGDLIYHNGTDNVRLAKGTATQVLTMNAGATAPEWAAAGGGSTTTATTKLPDIDVTQATGAITVALNAAIYQDFRSTTLTDGTPTTVLCDPADLVIPDGATLGSVTTVAADIAVLMLNNAGTAEFAVVNISGGVDLSGSGVISTTAIGTGSDSAGVVYSTTARTNLAYKVVKRFTAVNTAGTWGNPSAVADVIGAVSRKVAQVVYYQTGAVATGTTITPTDDTIPQVTEGDQYLSQTITPWNASSTLEIEVNISFSININGVIVIHLHKDGGANAIAALVCAPPLAGYQMTQTLRFITTAGSTSSATYTVRVGISSAGTVTINGNASARTLGGVNYSRITIKEYLP